MGASPRASGTILPGDIVTLEIPIANDGDRAYPGDRLRLPIGTILLGRIGVTGVPKVLARFAVPPLNPGVTKTVTVKVTIPPGPSGTSVLGLFLAPPAPQYTTVNDRASRPITIG